MSRARNLADLLDSSGDVKNDAMDNVALSDLDVTATAAEVNIMDGVTATTTELNIMDGVTATTAELNYVDGVTSNIQTQIDGITQATGNELENVSEDTTPQLGGNLDVAGNSIVSASNGDINITPNGTGSVVIDGLSHPQADGTAGQLLKTDGSGNLSFVDSPASDLVDDTTPQLGGNLDVNGNEITSASNGNIVLSPDGTGNVGIGTTSIANLGSNHRTLQINGKNASNAGALRLRSTDNTVDSGFWASSTATYLAAISNDPLHLRTNNTDRMVIDTGGKVGIGTSSPSRGLQIHHASDSNRKSLQFTDSTTGTASTDGYIIGMDSAQHGYIWNYENEDIYFGTNNTTRMRIKADGSWGKAPAGTTLQVVSTRNRNTASGGSGWRQFNISVTITPKSTSSKILLFCDLPNNYTGTTNDFYIRLRRGTTDLYGTSGNSTYASVNTHQNVTNMDGHRTGINFHILDSPSTTSAVTYTVQVYNGTSNTFYLNYPSGGRGEQVMTAMEIAG